MQIKLTYFARQYSIYLSPKIPKQPLVLKVTLSIYENSVQRVSLYPANQMLNYVKAERRI